MFPAECQPASRAGKQRGKGDDRWLWEPALRVVSEARPDWVLFENPLGINDVGLDGILADLEGLNYEVAPPLIIPACAVNSPQLRNRYWIVAHSTEQGYEGAGSEHREEAGFELFAECGEGNMADTEGTAGISLQDREESEPLAQNGRCDSGFWGNDIWLPCADGKLRRAPDDSFGVAHGLHRSVLAGLGNSIVPQVAFQIIQAIVRASDEISIRAILKAPS